MKSKKQSPVVSFIQSVWDNSNSGKGHSWTILNGALHQALRLAVTSHFKFEPDDFQNIMKSFRGGYWMGADTCFGHGAGFYSEAVECSNMSACLSFEKWNGMEPYLFLGKRLAPSYGGDCGLLVIDPKWKDVAPGSIKTAKTDEQLLDRLSGFKDGKWWVTGFDNEVIRLASYYSKSNEYGLRQGKPTKLMKLSHADLAEMSKVLRAGMRQPKEKEESHG